MTSFVLLIGWITLCVWAGGCGALVRYGYRHGELWSWGSLLIPAWPLFAVLWFWDEVHASDHY